MCGIAGFYQLNGQNLPENAHAWLKDMTDSISYRGPDGEGQWIDGPIALGHRRLSIIDLKTGAQPMTDYSGHVWISFNGEVYNFPVLRKELERLGFNFNTNSDTEVILNAWQAWGEACVERFEGMFAFVLFDKKQQKLFCARDRFGKKPFFYTIQDGRFIFASELTAIRRFPNLDLSVSPKNILRYLVYDYPPTPDSIYTEVQKLPPSHSLLIADGKTSLRRYWDIPTPLETVNASEYELAEELQYLLQLAVKRRMISDVPLGVFLSGGIDSSIVTGLMARQASKIKTFSIGFEEASYDESSYARVVAKHFDTDHCEHILSSDYCAEILPDIISRLDEPLADPSVAPTYILSEITRQHVTVALGGDGADELFAGYEHFIGLNLADFYLKWPKFLRKGLEKIPSIAPESSNYININNALSTFFQGAYAPPWLRVQTLLTAFTPDMRKQLLQESFSSNNQEFLKDEKLFAPTKELFSHWPNATSNMDRTFYVYARQFLVDDILTKVDRCSMLKSLEVRAPFLDTKVAEFAAKLPLRYKLKGLKRKYILKKSCANLLPKEILTRNKRGFQIPVAAWLRGSLRPLVEELLGERFLQEQSVFNVPYIRELVDAHMSGKKDLRKPLWTLLALQLWWRANTPKIL